MKKVQILLSSYNGEKYVEEQMNSLLLQTYPNIEVFIRDDGSTDKTVEILQNYVGYKNLTILPKRNIGVIGSFFDLLVHSSPEADYIAFCDQDDFWKEDKLSRAIERLQGVSDDVPAMYCSQAELVDENLNDIGFMAKYSRGPSFANALVQNIATGCTVVFNREARTLLLRKMPNPTHVIMHDWWVYLVVSAFGKVIYDPVPSILYRQHSSNSVGAQTTFVGKWVTRGKRFLKQGRRRVITKQVREFRELYGELLSPDCSIILDRFIEGRKTMWGRIKYALVGEAHRQSKIDDVIFRLLIVLNCI